MDYIFMLTPSYFGAQTKKHVIIDSLWLIDSPESQVKQIDEDY